MGHIGEATLWKLAACTTGMRPVPIDCPYHACIMGRIHEVPYTKPIKRGTYPMEFIHIDIAGPFNKGRGYYGAKYWVLFLDDHT
jgi:hypothetical protein